MPAGAESADAESVSPESVSPEPVSPEPVDAAPARTHHVRTVLVSLAVVFGLLVGVLGVGGYLFYRHLNANITVDNSADNQLRAGDGTGPVHNAGNVNRPDLQPLDILVMGSDTRVGQDGEGGSATLTPTAASDVVMLVHISADRQRAIVMSIPRDTWVHVPGCGNYNDQMGKFNLAYTFGGPACTIKLFKQVTGLEIDHFIVVDFNGVKNIINSLGGVDFCLAKPYKDLQYTGLNLPAGEQVINGDQGLAFLRVRHNVDDPTGDIGRLKRQHAFLSAMIRQIEGQSVLTNLPTLLKVLNATTASITTDSGLGSLLKLKDLAQSLEGLKPANITFVTVPWKDRGDGENVVIDTAAAQPLFDAIKNDTPWPAAATTTPIASTTTPSTSPTANPLVMEPSHIHVKVLNGTGKPGMAKTVAASLAAEGFVIEGVDTAPAVTSTTNVAYPNDYTESAATLAAAAGGVPSGTDSSLSTTLVLTVGTDFTAVQTVTVSPTASASPTTGTDSSANSTEAIENAATTGCW